MTRSFKEKGFTFLEVIVAVAIIAIVFTAALKMVSQSLALRSATRFYSLAPYLATVAEEKIEKEGFSTGQTGDYGDQFPGWHWTAEISRLTGNETYTWFDVLARINLNIKYTPDNLNYNIVYYRMVQPQ